MAAPVIGMLDTSVLIASRSHSEALPDLQGFDDLTVSSVSYSELTMGLHSTQDLVTYKQRHARLSQLKETFGAGIPYDDVCVQAYDDLLALVVERGGEPKAHRLDRMIAATALAHGLVLVTRNIAHFRLLEGRLELAER